MRIYIEEYGGFTASVYERDGKWWVQPVVRPDGGRVEMAMGKGLIDLTGISNKPFDSLERAESAAHEQLQRIVGETFGPRWREKC